MRRIGLLARSGEADAAVRDHQAALREALGKMGWIEGRNVRIDIRYSPNDPDRFLAHADELVRLAPT